MYMTLYCTSCDTNVRGNYTSLSRQNVYEMLSLLNKVYRNNEKENSVVTDAGRRWGRRAVLTGRGIIRQCIDDIGHRLCYVDTSHKRHSQVSRCTYSCRHDCNTHTLSVTMTVTVTM